MTTMLARLRSLDPAKGQTLESYMCRGVRFSAGGAFQRVDASLGSYLRTVRQVSSDASSPLAFEVVDEAPGAPTPTVPVAATATATAVSAAVVAAPKSVGAPASDPEHAPSPAQRVPAGNGPSAPSATAAGPAVVAPKQATSKVESQPSRAPLDDPPTTAAVQKSGAPASPDAAATAAGAPPPVRAPPT